MNRLYCAKIYITFIMIVFLISPEDVHSKENNKQTKESTVSSEKTGSFHDPGSGEEKKNKSLKLDLEKVLNLVMSNNLDVKKLYSR